MTNLERVYFGADKIAKANKQTVGKKKEFYITLEQLEFLLLDTDKLISVKE